MLDKFADEATLKPDMASKEAKHSSQVTIIRVGKHRYMITPPEDWLPSWGVAALPVVEEWLKWLNGL